MRLSIGHRNWVYTASVALFATGVLWLVFHYFGQVQGEFGPAPHPFERWWLRLHGFLAMLCLVLVGSLLPIHMRRGWHQRRNLPPAIALLALVLLLTLSGYGLYYLGSEQLRPWISLFHWSIGLAAPAVMIWHVLSGRSATALQRAARARQDAKAALQQAPPLGDEPPAENEKKAPPARPAALTLRGE